jgi:hypothetical protein
LEPQAAPEICRTACVAAFVARWSSLVVAAKPVLSWPASGLPLATAENVEGAPDLSDVLTGTRFEEVPPLQPLALMRCSGGRWPPHRACRLVCCAEKGACEKKKGKGHNGAQRKRECSLHAIFFA